MQTANIFPENAHAKIAERDDLRQYNPELWGLGSTIGKMLVLLHAAD